MTILGYSFYGHEVSQDDSTSLKNVKHTEYTGAIIDEISLRAKTDQGMSNVRNGWENDSSYLAKFINTLESGNLANDGVKVVKFRIVRRLVNQNQNEDIQMGEVPFTAGTNADMSFTDATQPNQKLVYTIIPVGENGLDGTPREITVDSEDSFTGWWVVDKDNGNVLPFDKAIGSVGNVENTLNQNRTLIETFSPHPQVFYNPTSYESFSLTTVLLPEEWERSGQVYQEILNKFILNHKPVIVKSDNGRIFVCDIFNPRTSNPLNSWTGHDYIQLTCDFVEIADYSEFMKE